jgi:hypothetical protein
MKSVPQGLAHCGNSRTIGWTNGSDGVNDQFGCGGEGSGGAMSR